MWVLQLLAGALLVIRMVQVLVLVPASSGCCLALLALCLTTKAARLPRPPACLPAASLGPGLGQLTALRELLVSREDELSYEFELPPQISCLQQLTRLELVRWVLAHACRAGELAGSFQLCQLQVSAEQLPAGCLSFRACLPPACCTLQVHVDVATGAGPGDPPAAAESGGLRLLRFLPPGVSILGGGGRKVAGCRAPGCVPRRPAAATAGD